MLASFRVAKLAFLDLWDEILMMVVFNLLWCVSWPLLPLLPFSTAGLAWTASMVGEGKAIRWRTFFDGGRRLLKPAYAWGVMSLMVWSLFFLNIWFYRSMDASWALYAEILFVGACFAFLLLQLYVFPFLIIQEQLSLREAFRNSLILAVMRPGLSVVVLLTTAVAVALSYFLVFPGFVFLGSFLALLGNRAVIETIKAEKAKEEGKSLLAK